MKKYQFQINGENFLVDIDNEVGKRGFIAFCHVEAESAEEAEPLAIQQLRQDATLRALVKNDPTDPPSMTVLEVCEVESFDKLPDFKGRYIWYSEDEKHTQQAAARTAKRRS